MIAKNNYSFVNELKKVRVSKQYSPYLLPFFKASKRMPPARKTVLRWNLDVHGYLFDMEELEVIIHIPETQEEYDAIPKACHKYLIWEDGSYIYPYDIWSFIPETIEEWSLTD